MLRLEDIFEGYSKDRKPRAFNQSTSRTIGDSNISRLFSTKDNAFHHLSMATEQSKRTSVDDPTNYTYTCNLYGTYIYVDNEACRYHCRRSGSRFRGSR